MKNKKVLVAMSGGVDSSVAAVLLVRAGYSVVGATMKLWSASDEKGRPGGCCSLEDAADARRVCRALGVKHYVLNFSEIFKSSVAGYFAAEYLSGRTPNPCVVCNETVKFGALFDKAMTLGFDYVATGHYARVAAKKSARPPAERYFLRRSADEKKDQTYFLYRVGSDILEKTLFPIGGLTKDAVRKIAAGENLPVASKKESRDACFAPGDYRKFVGEASLAGGSPSEAGDIVDEEGRILGRHDGIFRYTVGQRSGLGIAAAERLYVVRLDVAANRVVVGPRESALAGKFTVEKIFWPSSPPRLPAKFDVKIRYLSAAAAARVKSSGECLEAEFETPQFGVTPGQSAVFYDGDIVAGGGVIKSSAV